MSHNVTPNQHLFPCASPSPGEGPVNAGPRLGGAPGRVIPAAGVSLSVNCFLTGVEDHVGGLFK